MTSPPGGGSGSRGREFDIIVPPAGTPPQEPPAAGSLLPAQRRNRAGDATPHVKFISPAAVFIFLFVALPIAYVAYLSLRDFNLMRFSDDYIGFGNFRAALTDQELHLAIINTVQYVTVSLALEFVIGFGFALLCFVLSPRWSAVMRGVILLPLLLMPVSVGVLWKNVLFNPPYQMLNRLLSVSESVLANPDIALYGIIAATVWAYSPFVFIMMSAALAGIPPELIEAARIDGASFPHIVARVLLPVLRPVVVVVLSFAGAELFIEFGIPWVMTAGGPGGASHVLTTFIYSRAFARHDYGYGSSLALLMLAVAMVLSAGLIYHVWSGRHEESFS